MKEIIDTVCILALALAIVYLQLQIICLSILTGNDGWIDKCQPKFLRKIYMFLRGRCL